MTTMEVVIMNVFARGFGLPLAAACGVLAGAGCSTGTAGIDERPRQVESALPMEDFYGADIAYGSTPIPKVMAISLVSGNSLPSGLLANRQMLLDLRLLAAGPLDAGGGTLAPTALTETELGRRFLDYIVGCALPHGTDLALPNAKYAHGHVGLTPNWRHGALSFAGQRWLSACLLAHANDKAEVRIALSGAVPVLSSVEPVETHLVEEAAFYGNLFLATPKMYACTGWTGQSCIGPAFSDDLEKRVCGNSPFCGFTNVGPCHNQIDLPGTLDACSDFPGPYRRCAATTLPRGSLGPFPFGQVLTVHLRNTEDLKSLHPSACATMMPTP